MLLDVEQAKDIVYQENEYYNLIEENIVGKSRWAIHYQSIYHYTVTGKFYKVDYYKGATEQQETSLFEGQDSVEFKEVFPKQKMIIVFEEAP